MALEIQFIQAIEKHECLYNFNLPEYNRKDVVEEAWAEIAGYCDMSINDCKEKWRNIRSSYLRSMKPSRNKVKKPYYLSQFLNFILPFLKPISNGVENSEITEQNPQVETSQEEYEVLVSYIKPEPEDYDGHDNNEQVNDNDPLDDMSLEKKSTVKKKRRFETSTPRKPVAAIRKTKLTRNDETKSVDNTTRSALKMFLLSLLPELESMTEEQIRMFKIKTLTLIDDIKLNHNEMRQTKPLLTNERLQKRLINLLLANLKSNTNRDNNS